MVNKTQESIYKEFYPRVLQYLSNRLNERQDAENLAHTVFLKVFTKIDLFDESKSSLSTWIFNIVLHYYNGYPLTKISRMMQQPYGQIKRFHMKVINKLRMYIV